MSKTLSQPKPKNLKPKPPGTTDQLATSSLGSPNSDIGKLDELAEKIAREQAITGKTDEITRQKEDALLNPQPQEEAGFIPDPIITQVTAGMTFFLMKRVANIFEKDLTPLTDDQKVRLEAMVDKLLRKYVPASLSKYQESSEVFLVIGGIVITNLVDFSNAAQVLPKKESDKAPSIPPVPESNITVITADAPPAPNVGAF